jgi:hypothetical protein
VSGALLLAAVSATTAAHPATLRVDSASWTGWVDFELTLPEAIALADSRTPHCFSDHEASQIDGVTWILLPPDCLTPSSPGQIGRGVADVITFQVPLRILWPGGGSPLHLGPGDTLRGPSTLDAAGQPVAAISLAGDGPYTVERMTIVGFPFGISCGGCKNLTVRGSTFDGNGVAIEAARDDPGARNPDGLTVGDPGDRFANGNSIVHSTSHGIHVLVNPAYDSPSDFSIDIRNNWIGDDETLGDAGNGGDGVLLENVRGATIGGPDATFRNYINSNRGGGVRITGASAVNQVRNNYIGLDESGVIAKGNRGAGVRLDAGASSNTIWENVIAANGGPGVDIADEDSDGNAILGNRVGTTADGSAPRANAEGIRIYGGADDTIIGTGSDFINPGRLSNLISGNASNGVGIYNAGTTGTLVEYNTIGLDPSRTRAVPNTSDGVRIQEGATGAKIVNNFIAGNGVDGVGIRMAGTTGHEVVANNIGIKSGGGAVGNGGSGIAVVGGAQSNQLRGNVIGGNSWGIFLANGGTSGNVVSDNFLGYQGNAGNTQGGITLRDGASDNVVSGNTIAWNAGPGVDVADSATHGNTVRKNQIGVVGNEVHGNNGGIVVRNGSHDNMIGWSDPTLGNTVSGNNGSGILVGGAGTNDNEVVGNRIGLAMFADIVLPNNGDGIDVYAGATGTGIAGNNVTGNHGSGVVIDGITTGGTALMANVIGSNSGNGVTVGGGVTSARIGDTDRAFRNHILGNGAAGVRVSASSSARVLINDYSANNALGVDLAGAGVTPNNLGDGPVDGVQTQNFPVLAEARLRNATLHLAGVLRTQPRLQVRIHFLFTDTCDPSRHGEGAGSQDWPALASTSDVVGNLRFVAEGAARPVGTYVVTFADTGLTSELSTCRRIVAATDPLIFDDGFESGEVDGWGSWAGR